MNMYSSLNEEPQSLADFFQVLGQSSRLQILAALARRESCVCHLELLVGQRQAYISQQLGVLRRAKLVAQRREGKHVYYSLQTGRVLELVRLAAEVTGLNIPSTPAVITLPVGGCTCPDCLAAAQALPEAAGKVPTPA